MEHFSDRLRYARTLRDLSQAELARISGLSQGAISSYETRTRKGTTGIIQLAQALSVNPVWLVTGAGPMEHIDSALTQEYASELRDFERTPTSVTWPFTTIKASHYWSLPESERRIIEEAVATLVRAFNDEREKRQE